MFLRRINWRIRNDAIIAKRRWYASFNHLIYSFSLIPFFQYILNLLLFKGVARIDGYIQYATLMKISRNRMEMVSTNRLELHAPEKLIGFLENGIQFMMPTQRGINSMKISLSNEVDRIPTEILGIFYIIALYGHVTSKLWRHHCIIFSFTLYFIRRLHGYWHRWFEIFLRVAHGTIQSRQVSRCPSTISAIVYCIFGRKHWLFCSSSHTHHGTIAK